MVDIKIRNSGNANRDTFVNKENLDGHAKKNTREKQPIFYELERLVVGDQAKESFKRKPYYVK